MLQEILNHRYGGTVFQEIQNHRYGGTVFQEIQNHRYGGTVFKEGWLPFISRFSAVQRAGLSNPNIVQWSIMYL